MKTCCIVLFSLQLLLAPVINNAQVNENIFISSFELPFSPVDPNDVSRFLTQATFGVRLEQLNTLTPQTYADWLDQQRALTPSLHRPLTESFPPPIFQNQRQQAWWAIVLNSEDQLRQRIAFALSEIFVVSDNEALVNFPELLAEYNDILVRNALGNFRDLLREVSLSPAMGIYLSHLGNDLPDPITGRRPDENYAREIMQLFTIGLWQLNLDGSPDLSDMGLPQPTYTQADIEGLARVFTGWTFADSDNFQFPNRDSIDLMEAFEEHHDSDEKVIVTGTVLLAGQSAEEDLDDALDVLFGHPNVGPFIAYRLIQRLVTSNPSPHYIARVAQAFNDNGQGQRGDLFAVTQAILLDPEARQGHYANPGSFGKLREPLLRLSALWRAFDAAADSGIYRFNNPQGSFSQAALRSPTVFNFFLPNFQPPGEITAAGLVAPEFQIHTESSSIGIINGFDAFDSIIGRWYVGSTFGNQDTIRSNFDREVLLINNPDALIDRLSVLLMNGNMSNNMRTILLDYHSGSSGLSNRQRIANLVFLVVTSPEAAVQK